MIRTTTVVSVVISAACALSLVSASSSGCIEADRNAVVDDGVPCPAERPPPSDPCIPLCGNELGVGQPCTRGGFQCPFIQQGNEASFCTVDFDDTTLAFCTKPCVDDSDCGADAVCSGDPAKPDSDRGCTPASCI